LKASGLVGLSPRHFEANSDLFIEKMKKTGAISKAIFSMSIGFGDKQSRITFGGYDKERYSIGRVNWHQIDENSNYWSLKADYIQLEFNDQNISMGSQKAIVDSGTSYVMMPTPAYNNFMTYLI